MLTDVPATIFETPVRREADDDAPSDDDDGGVAAAAAAPRTPTAAESFLEEVHPAPLLFDEDDAVAPRQDETEILFEDILDQVTVEDPEPPPAPPLEPPSTPPRRPSGERSSRSPRKTPTSAAASPARALAAWLRPSTLWARTASPSPDEDDVEKDLRG